MAPTAPLPPRFLLLPVLVGSVLLQSTIAQPTTSRSCLPRLAPGTRYGTAYGSGNNASSALYARVIEAGASLTQLSIPWAAIEATPGVINSAMVASILQEARHNGLVPLFSVAAIDTNHVSAPPDLVDASGLRLKAGLTWQSPEVIDRYATMLESIGPIAVFYGAPYVGFGNEVDVNLAMNPSTGYDFVVFVDELCLFLRNITFDDVACGVTLTASGLNAMTHPPPAWFTVLSTLVDVFPLTYYPLNPDFTVKSPAAAKADVTSAVALLPPTMAIVMQEFGFPSGYGNSSSTDGSSQQLQADFFAEFFGILASLNSTLAPGPQQCGRVRAASAFAFADMPPAVCASFVPYYNVSVPSFEEYLCTL